MAASSLLSLSILVLLFSISSAVDSKDWSVPNGHGVSKDLLNVKGVESITNQPSGKRKTMVLGTWGAKVTEHDFDDGAYTGIREINFGYNKQTAIGGFQVTYDLNGEPFVGKDHPSMIKGFTPVKISLNFPSEYITEVSGYTGDVSGYTVVRSLTFKTNNKTYGPYGVTSGTPFNIPIENGKIVGFKGSMGYWMDTVGLYLAL